MVGIIEATEKEMEVGKSEKNKKWLRKFTLGTRERKRVRVLIWTRETIDKLAKHIKDGNVSSLQN